MRLGIGFTSKINGSSIAKCATLAEQKGFEQVWIGEHYYYRDAISLASFVVSKTNKIRVGLGVINPYTRNPVIIAMSTATMNELANGRIMLGIGPGGSRRVEATGVRFTKPATALRESLEIIRKLLAGETVTHEGSVFKINDVSLGFRNTSRVPIIIGAVGSKILRMAGECADGVLLSAGCPPGYIRFAVEEVKKGMKKAGRAVGDIEILSYIISSVAEDSFIAKEEVKKTVAEYISLLYLSSPKVLEYTGFDKNRFGMIANAILKGDIKKATDCVTDEILKKLAVTGTPEECLKQLEDYIAAGITLPVLFSPIGPKMEEAIELIGKTNGH